MAIEDKLDININQNLWGLIASYAALGIAEYWQLRYLRCLSLVTSIALTVSVLLTTGFYTWNYCRNKLRSK